MIVKQHISEGKIILAVCDDDVFGKRFEEGNKQLDLTADFFRGERKSKEETKKLMKKSHYLNLNGEKSVTLGIELKLIKRENILLVQNVPHAECVVVGD